MAERKPTRKPVTIAGTNTFSGTVNTGQVLVSFGGVKAYTQHSGTAGGDASLHVGAGRLDGVNLHPNAGMALSGLPYTFYDGSVFSGGPIAASGNRIIASLTPPPANLSSGVTVPGVYIPLGIPFTSGLNVASRSGMGGFTVSFTPVVSGTQNIG